MELGLRGKNALVTGASKGIGLAITRALVAEGAHVVAGARHVTAELQQLIEASQAHFVKVDLSVVLLASNRIGNVTGADFVIDGGLVKTL